MCEEKINKESKGQQFYLLDSKDSINIVLIIFGDVLFRCL